MKKTIALVLALILLAGTSTGALAFSDLSGGEVQAAVERLAGLGIIGGFPDGTYRPYDTLTRAQFCKIAIYLMNAGNYTEQYANFTIFVDVQANHWAAKYINTAAKRSVGGDQTANGIIGGFPDGSFKPDDVITDGQAVTIVLRILGYKDSEIGPLWPESYIAKAEELGITKGMSLDGNTPLKRGTAALIFANLLETKTVDGKKMIETLGYNVLENVTILATSETDSSLKNGELRYLSSGSTVTGELGDGVTFGGFLGLKGDLTFDENEEIVGFAAYDGTIDSNIVNVARIDGIRNSEDEFVYIAPRIPVYETDGSHTAYSDLWTELVSGEELILYYDERGNLEYAIRGSAINAEFKILAFDGGEQNPLVSAFPGLSDYSGITKDGVKSIVSDLRKYDVAYCNEITGGFVVSSRKFTGRLADAEPSVLSAEKINMYGIEFEVDGDCSRAVSEFAPGDMVTLLFSSSGKVVGAVSANDCKASQTAVIVSLGAESGELRYPSGIKLATELHSDYTKKLSTGLVSVGTNSDNTIFLREISFSSGAFGAFDVNARTLDGKKISSNAKIYETTGTKSALKEVAIEDILVSGVPANKVLYADYDSAGRAELIVLNDVTGDAYEYGKLKATTETNVIYDGEMSYTTTHQAFKLDNGETKTLISNLNFKINLQDGFGGVSVSFTGDTATNVISLKKIGSGDLGAFNGKEGIIIGGEEYKITDATKFYYNSSASFVTLEKAKNIGGTYTVYAEKTASEGGKARIIAID